MSILTKILIGLVVVATFPVIYLAAGVLNVQTTWRAKVNEFNVALERQKTLNHDLEFGSDAAQTSEYVPGKPLKTGQTLGINQLETARNNMMINNGRVWYATRQTQTVSPENNSVKIVVYDSDVDNVQFGVNPDNGGRKEMKEPGITQKTVLQVFQMAHNGERSDKDRYVGEFVVDGLIEANIPLRPTRPLTPEQWELMRQGDSQWVCYDKMPLDSRDLFIGLSEDEIKARLPQSVAAEYVNDNQKPTDELLADEKLSKFVEGDDAAGGKRFLRPLRDYELIFRTAQDRLEEMADKLQVLKKEQEFALRGKENAEKIIAALDIRKAKLEEDKLVVEKELMVVKEHSEKLAAAVEEMKQELSRLLEDNKRRREAQPVGGKTAAIPPAIPSPDAGAALAPQ